MCHASDKNQFHFLITFQLPPRRDNNNYSALQNSFVWQKKKHYDDAVVQNL